MVAAAGCMSGPEAADDMPAKMPRLVSMATPDHAAWPDAAEGESAQAMQADPAEGSEHDPVGTAPAPDATQDFADLLRTQPAGSKDPLARPVSISMIDTPLLEAAQVLSALTGIGMTVVSEGEPLGERRVNVVAQEAQLSHALDWIARQTDSRYTWDKAGVCIASDKKRIYGGELVSRVYPLRTMTEYTLPHDGFPDFKAEREATVACIRALLGEYLSNVPDATLTVAHENGELIATCSEGAHRRIEQIFAEIGRGKANPAPAPPVRSDIAGKLEAVVMCTFRDELVVKVLGELSKQAGVNIGVDPRDLPNGSDTRITLYYGKASLGFTLDTIVKLCKLSSYAIEEQGVWLHGERPYPAEGRLMWETGLIKSYYVEPAAKVLGIPQMLKYIEQNVTPGQWSGGLPAMSYARTGRLVVFHSKAGHDQLSTYLHVLMNSLSASDPW